MLLCQILIITRYILLYILSYLDVACDNTYRSVDSTRLDTHERQVRFKLRLGGMNGGKTEMSDRQDRHNVQEVGGVRNSLEVEVGQGRQAAVVAGGSSQESGKSL